MSSVLAEIIGESSSRPAPADMPAILASVHNNRGVPALKIRRCEPDEGPVFWRWDCARCGEYGGGRHHSDAISRAMRHCGEHPHHRSSLLPPVRCRERDRVPVHPAMFAVDDDLPPIPLSI